MKRKSTLVIVILLIVLCGIIYAFGRYWYKSSHFNIGKIKIIDQAGRIVYVPEKVDRIVSLWPEATRVLVALAVGDKIAGVATRGDSADPIFAKIFPRLKSLPSLGGMGKGANIEELISLKPDIIFQDARRPDTANDIQNKTGIPVVCVRITPPKLEGYSSFDLITLIGRSVHKEKRAIYLKKLLDDEVVKITKITSQIPANDRVKGLVIGPNKMLSGQGEPMESGGVINVALRKYDIWYHANLEQIIAWEPEIIFCHIFHKTTGVSPEYIYSHPQWQKVQAVKGRRIYNVIIGHCGSYPAARAINTMQIAKTAYPEKFRDLDIEREGNKIYEVLYGVDNFFSNLAEEYNIYIP